RASESGLYYSNQVVSELTAFVVQQNNYLPPSYYDESGATLCLRCGKRRQDFTTTYCPLYGQSFDEY
ncbi:unnamed protein product, partial [Rotaria sp. Silwood2]